MDFIDRFTEGARRALALSQDSAKEMGHNYVGSEHLLLGLIKEGEGAAARALAQLGIRGGGRIRTGGRAGRPRGLPLYRQLRLYPPHKEDTRIEPLRGQVA